MDYLAVANMIFAPLVALHTGWQAVDVMFLIVLPALAVLVGSTVWLRSRTKRPRS